MEVKKPSKTVLRNYLRKNNKIVGIAFGVVLTIIVLVSQIIPKTDKTQKSYLGQADKPRGVRNNNPGNIRYSPLNQWKGKVPFTQNTDGSFEQFVEWRYGVRALIALLKKYIERYGTIERIISVYAPAVENNTNAYINAVATALNQPRNQVLDTSYETLRKLTIAVANHEVGKGWVTNEDFNNSFKIL